MWFQKNKWNIILPALVIAVLAAAFCFGGDVPSSEAPSAASEIPAISAMPETETSPEIAPVEKEQSVPSPKPADIPEKESEPESTPAPAPETQPPAEIESESNQDQYLTDPVPEGKPSPTEPKDATISTTAHACTISISCATILEKIDTLDSAKADLIPADGWILPPTSVTFYEGESVFNVLQRTCKQQKIHMEFEDTPIYNSAYIEGIHNLYEFDVGELSGWMYSVNNWFPNYGCSRYQLHDGDVICWVYTCDLGADVGGEYSAGNGRG